MCAEGYADFLPLTPLALALQFILPAALEEGSVQMWVVSLLYFVIAVMAFVGCLRAVYSRLSSFPRFLLSSACSSFLQIPHLPPALRLLRPNNLTNDVLMVLGTGLHQKLVSCEFLGSEFLHVFFERVLHLFLLRKLARPHVRIERGRRGTAQESRGQLTQPRFSFAQV
jgi:hypothetical protein